MEDTGIIGKFICAAIFGFALGSLLYSVVGGSVPETAENMQQLSTLKSVSFICGCALGGWLGWRGAGLIIQSAFYIWMADLVIAAIHIVWN